MEFVSISTILLLLVTTQTATAINCFICNASDSTNPFQCGEWFDRFDTPDIKPQDCTSVYGAKYCIKHIGRFEANTIRCFQCSSAETINCSDLMINQHDTPLIPGECDHVHGAAYCIKSTALDGGIGAKRFCSSKDLGNYCNYVQNKGDQMEYRSCIFTCNTDGCNHSTNLMTNNIFIVCAILILSALM